MKDEQLIVRQRAPLNSGPRLQNLCRDRITPNSLFYVRNHGEVPRVDAGEYRLIVDGAVTTHLNLSLHDIRIKFAQVTLPATLQCAGNRRQELMKIREINGEIGWGPDAIGTAEWLGVRLGDVLSFAGIPDDPAGRLHVAFTGLDEAERNGTRFLFGGSIPLEKAVRSEVLLAHAMNGVALAPEHGFPLRVVVPGYIGARSVKWVKRITVQEMPSDNFFQMRAYRLFPPDVGPETVDWSTGLILGETNVSSVICSPADNDVVVAGPMEVAGYAIAGGGRTIARVDVSANGGVHWRSADLLGREEPWTWRLWRTRFDLPRGEHHLVVRAVDSAANIQPESQETVWNFKGYMNNAWHRVTITAS